MKYSADPGKYFIINLERKDKYDDGHIPGAIRYKPECYSWLFRGDGNYPF